MTVIVGPMVVLVRNGPGFLTDPDRDLSIVGGRQCWRVNELIIDARVRMHYLFKEHVVCNDTTRRVAVHPLCAQS